MAPAQAIWDAANEKEVRAWNALFEVRPTTMPGVLALIRHAQNWASENDGVGGTIYLREVFGAIAGSLSEIVAATEASGTLVRDILDGWAAWAPIVNKIESSAEDIAAWEQSDARRDRLLHAAMDLPATSENIVPKALACAWMEWVGVERPGQPREYYGRADQLVYDIHATIMAQNVKTSGEETREVIAPEAGNEFDAVPAGLADACLWAVRHRAWIDQELKGPVEWSDERFDAESGKVNAVFARAIEEPSTGTREIAAKASLALEDYERFVMSLPGKHDDGQRIVHTVLREAAGLSTSGPDLVGLVDFSAATMGELHAIHDMTNEVSTMAHALVSSGRGSTQNPSSYNDRLTPAGHFMLWVAEALNAVEDAAYNEIKRRKPSTRGDQEIRLRALASLLIANGDRDETAAFARELLAFAKN
jgi:hypothetical protein